MKSVTLHVGVSDARANLPPVMRLIETGRFVSSKVKPAIAAWEDAPRAFIERGIKLVVHRAPLLA